MRDYISEEEKETKGKVVSSGKNNIKINPSSEELKERTMGAREKAREETLKQKYDPSGMKASMIDKYGKEKGKQVYFATIRKKAMSKNDNLQDQFAGNYEGPLYAPHPDLVKEETPVEKIDRIAREKVAQRSKESADKKAERESSAAAFQAHKKEVLAKGGRPVDALDSWQKKKMQSANESAVPGKPAEKLGAVTAIPKDQRDAAKARILAKAAAKRKELGITKEEFEIEEGMTMKDFKANRRKLKRKEASTDAKKRGHVGKEWYNSGRTYSPDEAKSGRAKMDDEERSTRKRSAIDPDAEDSDYSADKTKNPKKLRKQKAMGEAMSFSDFMEARRMDKEGVDRGDSRRAERAEKAKASLAAVKKGEERKQKVSKKYGIEPSKADTVEKRAHKRDFAGSRQAPKQKGAKETDLQTHNRRVNAANKRRMTHGWTSKEKAANRGMENAGSRFD